MFITSRSGSSTRPASQVVSHSAALRTAAPVEPSPPTIIAASSTASGVMTRSAESDAGSAKNTASPNTRRAVSSAHPAMEGLSACSAAWRNWATRSTPLAASVGPGRAFRVGRFVAALSGIRTNPHQRLSLRSFEGERNGDMTAAMIEDLERRMREAADAGDFETAAALRDAIARVRSGESGLQAQEPGKMGLGSSQERYRKDPSRPLPKKPDPMTTGHKPGGRRRG